MMGDVAPSPRRRRAGLRPSAEPPLVEPELESGPSAITSSDEEAVEQRVDRERVGVLYSKAPIALLTVLVNSALLVWLLLSSVPGLLLLPWLVTLWMLCAGRWILLTRHREVYGEGDPAVWERRFVLGSALNGVVWGAGASLFVGVSLPLTVAVVFVIGGMVAGASSSSATSLRAYLGFCVPAVLPVALALALGGDTTSTMMAVMLVLFGAAMTLLARQGGDAIIDAIRLRQHAVLAQQRQFRSEERSRRLAVLLDQAGVAIVLADPRSLDIVDVNESAVDVLGVPPPGQLRSRLPDLATAGLLAEELDWEALIARAYREGEQLIHSVRSGSRSSTAHFELSLVIQAVGTRDYVLLTLRDVTERKQLETRLAESSMMASMATLAASVAHEVNNPLGYILTNLQHLRECLDSPEPLPREELGQAIEEAIEGTKRIGRIVDDLTSTPHRDPEGGRESADVIEVLESCVALAGNEIRYRARLVQRFEDVPPVAADSLRLTQVFLKLLLNATNGIPEGDADRHRISLDVRFDWERERVQVVITDDGDGIAHPDLDRLFEPFATSTASGVGLDLGLSVCRALIDAVGGTLSVASEVGQGTTFLVELRAASAPTDHEREPSVPIPVGGPSRRILVVDDDEYMARSVNRILTGSHEVTVVASAQGALAVIAAEPPFDLILCDMMMPGMNGVEFFEKVRKRWPEQLDRIAFLTGGAFTTRTREFLSEVTNPCLSKPFTASELRKLVATMTHRADVA